jgi:hypothetical protein
MKSATRWLPFSQEQRAWVLAENLKFPGRYAARLMVDHGAQDWRDVIPRITLPTLVIGGRASFFTPKSQEWIGQQIPGARVEIFDEHEGGSHFSGWRIRRSSISLSTRLWSSRLGKIVSSLCRADGKQSAFIRLEALLRIRFFAWRSHAMVAVMNTARRQATYQDLLKVPDILVAEIIDGELLTSPRPASSHARAASSIGQDVSLFDRRPGGPGEINLQ